MLSIATLKQMLVRIRKTVFLRLKNLHDFFCYGFSQKREPNGRFVIGKPFWKIKEHTLASISKMPLLNWKPPHNVVVEVLLEEGAKWQIPHRKDKHRKSLRGHSPFWHDNPQIRNIYMICLLRVLSEEGAQRQDHQRMAKGNAHNKRRRKGKRIPPTAMSRVPDWMKACGQIKQHITYLSRALAASWRPWARPSWTRATFSTSWRAVLTSMGPPAAGAADGTSSLQEEYRILGTSTDQEWKQWMIRQRFALCW